MFKRKTIFEINKLSTRLVSSKMGCDRGTPIDRYYIEQFLMQNADSIKGVCMEIGDSTYTDKFGVKVTENRILTQDVARKIPGARFGDLVTGEGLEEESVDCFILTQTLPFIYDVNSAAKNIVKVLKSGGKALITVRGISMVSEYDATRWGDYWGFTENSLRHLFAKCVEVQDIQIQSYGNPKTAVAFLLGLSQEDLKSADFEDNNTLTPVILTAVIQKQ